MEIVYHVRSEGLMLECVCKSLEGAKDMAYASMRAQDKLSRGAVWKDYAGAQYTLTDAEAFGVVTITRHILWD